MRLIDADALIEQINSIANNDKVDKFKAVKFVVEYAPTIEAEQVRHGEWCGEWERGRYMCSACKTMTDVAEIMGKPAYKFCPHCGAVMSGGADE